WSRMAHALWKTWQRRGCPAECEGLFAPDGPHRELLWPHLPPEVFGAAWARWTERDEWPFACFGPAQWAAFVDYFCERWQHAPGAPAWLRAFEHASLDRLPPIIVRAGLLAAEGSDARTLLERAWRRHPAGLSALLRERAAAGDARGVARLLDAAP